MSAGFAAASIAVLLAGCAGWSGPPNAREQAEEVAEINLDKLIANLTELAPVVDGVRLPPLVTELESAGLYVLETPPDGVSYPDLPRGAAVYDYDAASFPVGIYVPGSSQVNAALSNVSSIVFGCGRVDVEDVGPKVTDTPCPRWLVAWAGNGAIEIPLSSLTE